MCVFVFVVRRSGLGCYTQPKHPCFPQCLMYLATLGSNGVCFVITRPAISSPWTKASPKLMHSDFWLWHIVKVYEPGSLLPGFTKAAETYTYEGHLYSSVGEFGGRGRWEKTWERIGPAFMRTEEDKHVRQEKKEKKLKRASKQTKAFVKKIRASKAGKATESNKSVKSVESGKSTNKSVKSVESSKSTTVAPGASDQLHTPLRSYLRPANIVGGGFSRTPSG